MRNKFSGVGVALITPFNEDFSVDYDALKKLVLNVISEGVDYLVVNGTTAEASTLTEVEKSEILSFVAHLNNGKLPIMYGIGANNTQHVLDLIKSTDFSHIDAILTVSPYYNKPSQAGIVAHYEVIANECPVPVLLYNVPGRTGSNMTADTTLTLSKHPNIFGIKEASGDLEQCLNIVKSKPDNFMLISGDDLLTVPMVSIGAEGAISVLANAYPQKFSLCIKEALKGDFKHATSGITDFLPLNNYLYLEGNPVGIKEVLVQKGEIKRQVRLPLLNASSELQALIAKAIL